MGALRLRMFRPFPAEILRSLLKGCGRIGVLDRDISLGLGGVLWSEVLGTTPRDSIVQNYILGLGGGDIRPEHIAGVLSDLQEREAAGKPEMVEVS